MARSWLVALVIVGSMVVGVGSTSGTASACSCMAVADDEAFAAADAVFTGRLIEVRGPTVTLSSSDPSRFVFAVDRVFKGEVFATQSVVSASDGASCGLEVPYNFDLVVFGRSGSIDYDLDAGEYESGLCSGSRVLSSSPLPAVFGDGAPPLPGSSPIGEDDALVSKLVRGWYWPVAGVIVLVTCGVLFRRSRRRAV